MSKQTGKFPKDEKDPLKFNNGQIEKQNGFKNSKGMTNPFKGMS